MRHFSEQWAFTGATEEKNELQQRKKETTEEIFLFISLFLICWMPKYKFNLSLFSLSFSLAALRCRASKSKYGRISKMDFSLLLVAILARNTESDAEMWGKMWNEQKGRKNQAPEKPPRHQWNIHLKFCYMDVCLYLANINPIHSFKSLFDTENAFFFVGKISSKHSTRYMHTYHGTHKKGFSSILLRCTKSLLCIAYK